MKHKPMKKRKRSKRQNHSRLHDLRFFAILCIPAIIMIVTGLYLQGWRLPQAWAPIAVAGFATDFEMNDGIGHVMCSNGVQMRLCPGEVPRPQHKPVESGAIDYQYHEARVKFLEALDALSVKEHNEAEATRVDDRSAQQARDRGREIVAKFCSEHPWVDSCQPENLP